MLRELVSLLMPDYCHGCGRPLRKGEQIICLHCRYALHRPSVTTLEAFRNKFNIPVSFIYAHWTFVQHGRAQQIIHGIKYSSSGRLAHQLGRDIGKHLLDCPTGTLVPAPQHPFRTYRRGYNQAAALARGIAETTGLPVENRMLQRYGSWRSQTSRSRTGRLRALSDAVRVKEGYPSSLFLLVDDVVTTGATMQTCAERILDIYPESNIGLITLATV